MTCVHLDFLPLSSEYGDMGGMVDGEADVALVAARELLEETAGTVNVDAQVVEQAPAIDCGIFHR